MRHRAGPVRVAEGGILIRLKMKHMGGWVVGRVENGKNENESMG